MDFCKNATGKSPLDDFPEIFTEEQLRRGYIVFYILAAIYFFILLAIICNDYFLPSVEYICEDLNLSKDVAAATFMATATSMPEFFTNAISTLITDSDMGLGNIIGSLMFNTLGVAGLSALALKKPIQLDWWPISRDCFLYGFNTIVLLIVAWGGIVTFKETCVLMCFLFLYYIVTFNSNIFMPIVRVFFEDKLNCCLSTRYDLTSSPEKSAKAKLPVKKEDIKGEGLFVINPFESMGSITSSDIKIWNREYESGRDSDVPTKIFSLPSGQTKLKKSWWCITLPLKMILCCLIPNPKVNRTLYPLTFFMCIILIGINAFMIVWMLTAFGVVANVPEIVMGLTFLSAGSTMPEAISSLISLKKGECGVGVSNSLGANSLAILLSLGVPWFIKNCIDYSKPGLNAIRLTSNGIELNIMILIISTILLFIILSLSDYRLTKKSGIALFAVYGLFITIQILLEMNVLFSSKPNC